MSIRPARRGGGDARLGPAPASSHDGDRGRRWPLPGARALRLLGAAALVLGGTAGAGGAAHAEAAPGEGAEQTQDTAASACDGSGSGQSASTGSITWSAVDEGGEPLGGSTWKLAGPGPAVQVADDEGQPGYQGVDSDSQPGEFCVGGLAWGEYTVTESAAPAGYQLAAAAPADAAQTSIDAENPRAVLGAFRHVSTSAQAPSPDPATPPPGDGSPSPEPSAVSPEPSASAPEGGSPRLLLAPYSQRGAPMAGTPSSSPTPTPGARAATRSTATPAAGTSPISGSLMPIVPGRSGTRGPLDDPAGPQGNGAVGGSIRGLPVTGESLATLLTLAVVTLAAGASALYGSRRAARGRPRA